MTTVFKGDVNIGLLTIGEVINELFFFFSIPRIEFSSFGLQKLSLVFNFDVVIGLVKLGDIVVSFNFEKSTCINGSVK